MALVSYPTIGEYLNHQCLMSPGKISTKVCAKACAKVSVKVSADISAKLPTNVSGCGLPSEALKYNHRNS